MATTPKIILAKPFAWTRREGASDETWEVSITNGPKLPHFVVKNYGGEPNEETGFSGWRLVSGGPFTRVGGWTSRDDAIAAATPFLVEYFRNYAQEEIAKADAILRQMGILKVFLSKSEK